MSLAIATHHRRKKHRALVVNISQIDPTRTLVLRRQFSAQMTNRFRDLKGAINRKLIDENFLQPRKDSDGPMALADFEYTWGARKVDAFMGWLKSEQDAGVLEIISRPGGTPGGEPWTNTYVQSAYQKGITQGRANLRAAGAEIPTFATLPGVSEMSVAFNQPFHAERVALIYTRVFEDLKGVTATMDAQISRRLARGMAEGRGPREIARQINDRVDKIGLTRARLIARTEVVHTHNIAALNEYEQASNVMGETIQVQWFTARDGRVRPHHITRHEKVYDRDVARTLIGEPNCRCALLPWIPSIQGSLDDQLNRAVRAKPKAVKKKAFVPAKTLKSAKKWAEKNVAEKVDFGGMSVHLANEVNKTLNDMIVKRKKRKLAGLFVNEDMALQGAHAGVSGNQIFINHNLKISQDVKKIQISHKARIKELKQRIKLREAEGLTIDGDRKLKRYNATLLRKEHEDAINELNFLFMKGDHLTMRDLITHEYGHIADGNVQRKLIKGIRITDYEAQAEAIKEYDSAKRTLFNDLKNKQKISNYARDNYDEFQAEAWAAYHGGGRHLLTERTVNMIEYMIKESM